MFSPLEQFEVFAFFNVNLFGLFLPTALSALVVLFCGCLFFQLFFTIPKIVPFRWQQVFEYFIFFVFSILKQQMGFKGVSFFPLVLTFFLFIFFCNILSLTPFAVALTSHIIIIILLTFTIILFVFFKGLLLYRAVFLKLFAPEAPFLLLFLLVPIELFSYSIRTLSLAIRLSANIIAGHTLVFIICNFLLLLSFFDCFLFFFPSFLLLATLLLEFGVAFLQAYVFIVLFCIYMHDSLYLSIH